MTLPDAVQQKLESLPAKPGVYLFKDKKGGLLYIGKAKSLRSRVRSYFQAGGSDERQFLPFLQRSIRDLETIVTASEKEAAILENNLVKQHQPRFNIKLRDDKNFISLRLGLDHAWPRLEVVRGARDDAATSGPITRPRLRGARSTSSTSTSSFAPAAISSSSRASARASNTKSSAAPRRVSSTSTRPGTPTRCGRWRCSSTVATTSSRASSSRR
jgi:excinuclease ABC subunit C